MVLALALIGWDVKMGATFDFTYPANYDLTFDVVNRIYMAHSINQDNFSEEELIEITLEDKIILSYCNKGNVSKLGYEMVILIVHPNQKILIESIKKKLMIFARDIINRMKHERQQYILENLEIFFKKATEKKLLLVGRAGTGKSSIKDVVFEGNDPKALISHPLEPTRGITPSVYSWLDLKLGLFDTSGQEIEDLLIDGNEQVFAFTNSDVIIYILDFSMWVVQKDVIMNDIQKILNIIKGKSYNSKFVIFFHKIDLINFVSRENIISSIKKILESEFKVPLYFTSLYPDLIYNLYNAFYSILSSFSALTTKLRANLEEKVKDHSKTIYFITNNNYNIIAQSMSTDFDVTLINHIQKLTAQLTQSFEEMCLNDNIETLTLNSTKNLFIIMKHVKLEDYDIKNLICASETLNLTNLLVFAHQIKLNCINLIYQLDMEG